MIEVLFARAAAAAAIVLGVLLACALYVRRRRGVAVRLGDAEVVRALLGADLRRAPRGRLAAVGLAAFAIAAALLDPSVAEEGHARGGPVVLLLDASGSMLTADMGGPRLDVERDIARRLVDELSGLPIGVVAFSGDGFTLTPPTRDRAAVHLYLESLEPGVVSQTGSGLGGAIRQGLALLSPDAGAAAGTLVLFSDGGENVDPEAALEAASLAGRSGSELHVVGIGTAEGGPVPEFDLATGTTRGFLRDSSGAVVNSRMDGDFLRSLAQRGRGSFTAAQERDAVAPIASRIAGRAAPRSDERSIPRASLLAGLAFLLLIAEPRLERWNR